MGRVTRRIVMAIVLVGAGWVVGSAQSQVTEPDFEISVVAPPGRTEITCVRGCSLKWVERGNHASSTPMSTFSYGCEGAGATNCGSGRIGGWVER